MREDPLSILSSENLEKILPSAASIVSLLLILAFLVLGIVIVFHWKKYGLNFFPGYLFQFVYFAIGAILIIGMIVAQNKFLS